MAKEKDREGKRRQTFWRPLQRLKSPHRPHVLKVAAIFCSSKVETNSFNMWFFERHLDLNYGSTIHIYNRLLFIN